MVTDPDTGNLTTYTRATTVASTLDSKDALIDWKATMVVTGMLRRPGLRARWEALCSEWPQRGPWYGNQESKAEAKKLVEECSTAGGASDRAEIGTSLHSLTHALDEGRPSTVADTAMQADLDAYRSTIEAAGITYHHAGIECCVVLDDHRVAGQADRLVTNVPGCELPVVADLKTGHDLFFSWGSIAIQLAIYAHASSVYRFGEARDGSEDRRIEMPAVDQTRALVIHLPAGEARCDLWWVDLEAGWEAFQIAMWQRGWRDRCRMLSTTVTLPPLAPSETATVPPAPSCELGVDQPGDAAGPVDRRADLQRRIDAIKAHDGVDLLIENWPAGVPTLRQSPVHSVDQLDRIALVLEAVEAKVLPFDPPPRELVELCPEDLRVTLVERFRALPDDLRAAVKAEAESRGLRTPSGQVFRTTDATDLEPVLVAAEEEHTQRRQTCAEALVNFEVDQIEAVFATVGYRNGQAIDATTAERICSVASALDTGLLELIPGMASLHAPTCIDRLVEAHGSKRALLSVARTAADGLGLAKPGSSAEIAAQPLLVAALAAGAEREEVKV